MIPLIKRECKEDIRKANCYMYKTGNKKMLNKLQMKAEY